MTGFIYLRTPESFGPPSGDRFCPGGANLAWSAESGGERESLWAWGGVGDVWVARRSNLGFLALSGYVSEVGNGPKFRQQSQAAQYLLESFERGSEIAQVRDLLEQANGSFSVLYRQREGDRSLCATDRVVSRPLWTFQQGPLLAVSTHASAIAAALRLSGFDEAAVTSLLLYGGPVEPRRSLFKGVTGVGPGSIVALRKGHEPAQSQWYTFRHHPDLSLSRSQWVERSAECLVSAAKRILALDEKPVVFFSGGTDSRLAASALKAAGGNPLLVTLGDSANIEVKVAQHAARALGLRHEVLLRDRFWYLRGLHRAVFESAGSFVWTHAHFSQAADLVAERNPGAAFVLGDFCEAFSKLCCSVPAAARGPWTPSEFARQFDSLPLPLYQPSNRAESLSLLKRGPREDAEELLHAGLASRYEDLRPGTSDSAILADQFLRWNHVGTIATFFMFLDLRSAAPDRNLMFDRDVHSLVEELPAHVRDSSNFGAALISKLAPRAAWVANSNSLLPLCFPPVAHQMSKNIKPLLGRVRRWWLNNPHTTTGSWPSRYVLYVGDHGWRAYIDRVLKQADCLDDRLFDHDAVRRSWQELRDGNKQRAGDVEKVILLVELTQMLSGSVRQFVEDDPSAALEAGATATVSQRSGDPVGNRRDPVRAALT